MGVGVGVGVGVEVSSMNFGEDGFGCCTDDGLKPVRVGLVFGEAVTRRGFDTVKSESFFVNGLAARCSCDCDCDDDDDDDDEFNIIRAAFFSTGLDDISLSVFDEDSFVSVDRIEHGAQILVADSVVVWSLFAETSVVENSSFFFSSCVKGFTGD